jgi:hypothetical protein
MFGSSLSPVVYRRAHVLFAWFVFVTYGGVQHILCCVFVLFLPPVVYRRAHVLFVLFVLCFCSVFIRLVYPMLPISLDCPF